MNIKDITLHISTGSISGFTFGDPNGMPILATHGWLDNAASFLPLAPFLKAHHVIVFDLPGHGFSTHRPKGSYFHFVDYLADVIQILDELDLPKAALLGHSLGAGIFALIAGTIPERISHLALLDALGPFACTEERLPELIKISSTQYRLLASKKLPQYDSRQQALEARLKASVMKVESAEYLLDRGLQQIDDKFYWRTDPRLLIKPLVMFTESQIAAFLRNITSPTCLIRPDQGWPFSETVFTERTKLIQNIEIHRIPGHHHVHMDMPDVVANILNPFFQRTA